MDLGTAANEHWRNVYRGLIAALGGEWRKFGAVDAFVTRHVPMQFGNGLLVLGRVVRGDVVDAIEWVRAADVPYSVRVDAERGRDVMDVPVSLGLEQGEWRFPGMALTHLPHSPRPPDGVTAVRVDRSNHADFIHAVVGLGMPREFALAAFGEQTLALPDVAMFVGYLDGRPAGTSLLARTGNVSGIYSVGVVEDARRRGIGSAVTWACVDQAREWGSSAVFLQSTQMGFGVYSAMGFETVAEYASFAPPSPDHEATDGAKVTDA